MKYLNKRQLAFILDIKVGDARAMMCQAYQPERNGVEVKGAEWSESGKNVEDNYPEAMPIELLSKKLNLPHLQTAADDIENNYLSRPASKKYILCDYPETLIRKAEEAGKQFPIPADIPPALRSMLPEASKKQIYDYWRKYVTNEIEPKPRFVLPK